MKFSTGKRIVTMSLLLMTPGAHCNRKAALCSSESPGDCPAEDISGLMQTRVHVSELGLKDEQGSVSQLGIKDKDVAAQQSQLTADRAYYSSLMDMSKAKYMAGVPIYNSDHMPGGLHPSELQLAEAATMIAGFTDKAAMEKFCADLLAAHNDCKCDAKEGAIKEAIFECSENDLQTFLDDQKKAGNLAILPTFMEPDPEMHALPVFDVEYNQTSSLLEVGRRGYTNIWGIDRIDDVSSRDNDYTVYPGSNEGSGAHVYVADTGIRYDHVDFEGRAETTAEFLNGNGNPTICAPDSTTCGYDSHGHGTHCAGTVGGKTYGVAKKVKLYALKVLNDQGYGSGSDIVSSVDWVITHGNKPAVWSASLGGSGRWASYEQAFKNAVANNVVISVAAGNNNADACNYSPAYAPTAITVGSTTSSDGRSYFSNYGTCLDIWAPGSSIKSASAHSSTGSATMSGTSMACPHVSGVMALFLADMQNPTVSGAESTMKNIANAGEISDIKSGSPDKMLYTGGDTNPNGPTPSTCTSWLTFNPPDAARSFSSVFANSPTGVGYAQSMLDSPQAWSSAYVAVGAFMIMDMGQVVGIEGVVTQARKDAWWQYVTKFTVQTSSDSSSWQDVTGTFTGSTDQNYLEAKFPATVEAQYVKVVAQEWSGWLSMRGGTLLCETSCNKISVNPFESSRTYSSIFNSDAPGTGHAQSTLDSPQAWCAAGSAPGGEWMTMDLGEQKWIRGVETRSRADVESMHVLTYTVEHSSDGSTWLAIPGTMQGAQSSTTAPAYFPSVVKARYVKLVPQTWAGATTPCMRAGVVCCDDILRAGTTTIGPPATTTSTTATEVVTAAPTTTRTTTSTTATEVVTAAPTTTRTTTSATATEVVTAAPTTSVNRATTTDELATTTAATGTRPTSTPNNLVEEIKTAVYKSIENQIEKLSEDIADAVQNRER